MRIWQHVKCLVLATMETNERLDVSMRGLFQLDPMHLFSNGLIRFLIKCQTTRFFNTDSATLATKEYS